MKKITSIILGLVLLLGFTACGNNTTTKNEQATNTASSTKQDTKQESQEEINQKIKSEAVKADFAKINGHETEESNKNKSFFIEGEVTNIDDSNKVLPLITVTTKEGSGNGMYSVLNFEKVALNKGDKVKVYGKLSGKSDLGMPKISGNIIEKQ